MSKLKILKKICNRFDIPFSFIQPTLTYFESHKNIRPHLFDSFIKKIKSAKKISGRPVRRNLKFNPKLNMVYAYLKLIKSDKYLRAEKIKKLDWDTVVYAKNWRTDFVYMPKLFINFHTPEGVRIRMHIRGDGAISCSGRVSYFNTNKFLLEQFKRDLFTLFGECRCSMYRDKIMVSKTISRVFYGKLGYPQGLEICHDFGVDDDILNAAPSLKKEAISAYFDDEGRFHANSLELVKSTDLSFLPMQILEKIIENPRKYSQYAPSILLDIKKMLEQFGILVSLPFFYKGDLFLHVDCYGYLRLSVGWRIRISGEQNLRIFKEKIGFYHPDKQKKLIDYLNNIKFHRVPKSRSLDDVAYEHCKMLQNTGKDITVRNLMKINERSATQARRWIYSLKNKNILKELSMNKIILKRNKKGQICKVMPKKYILNQNSNNPEN